MAFLLVSGLCLDTSFKTEAYQRKNIIQPDTNKNEELVNGQEIQNNSLMYLFSVNKENAVGYDPANEHEEIGPDTFFVSDGTVFIDDTINNQIMVYSNGAYKKKIRLQDNMNAMLMFYDSLNDTLKIVYEDLFREDETDLYLYMTSVCVSGDNEVEKGNKICKNNKMPIEYYFDMDGNLVTEYPEEFTSLEHVDENLKNSPEYKDTLTSWNDISYDLCTTYTSKTEGGIVTEYILKNDLEDNGIYAVPEKHEGVLDRGNIQVTKEGNIYQMVVDLTGVKIYQLCTRSDGLAEQNKLVRTFKNNVENDGSAIYASYKDMTTTKIKNRMDKYEGLSWIFNSNKNSDKSVTADKSKVTQPSWLRNLADGKNHKVTNIPYCWGGWNAESFIENINNGKFAGNVNTTSSGYISGTVGMDCSGYVSVAFDLPYKHGTSTLSNCFSERKNYDNVAAYDILNKVNDHVIIVVKVYSSGGKKYVDTYEENKTAGKVEKKTGRNYQSLLNNGYKPMKYKYLQ